MEKCQPIRLTIELNIVRIDLASGCFAQAFAVRKELKNCDFFCLDKLDKYFTAALT